MIKQKPSHGPNAPASPLPRRVTFRNAPQSAEGEALPLVAVVVTIYDGSSYDPLFREYKLDPQDGRASVWECSSAALRAVLDELLGDVGERRREGPVAELCAEITEVSPDSVVFNWECCSGCSDHGFTDTALTMRAADVLTARGFTLMFSDFSLKALISAWSKGAAPRSFGPCPLVKIGEFSSRFELRFDAAALQSCGSAQLERVGDLCDKGEASVRAMGGTVAYTVDHDALGGAPYTLEVLTVATAFDGSSAFDRFGDALRAGRVCVIGSHRGAAGHVRVHLATKGALLLSCGHWVELVSLDVSAERLVEVATRNFDSATNAVMAQELSQATDDTRGEVVQRYARQMVNQSSPGRYTKRS